MLSAKFRNASNRLLFIIFSIFLLSANVFGYYPGLEHNWGPKAPPSGTVVGTTDTQTLTHKTFGDDVTVNGTITANALAAALFNSTSTEFIYRLQPLTPFTGGDFEIEQNGFGIFRMSSSYPGTDPIYNYIQVADSNDVTGNQVGIFGSTTGRDMFGVVGTVRNDWGGQLELQVTDVSNNMVSVIEMSDTSVTANVTFNATNASIAKLNNLSISAAPLSALNIVGAYSTTLNFFSNSNLNFPSSGTVSTIAGAETLQSKTVPLVSNTISGTIEQFNTALSDGDFATLAGPELLTNKTLDSTNSVSSASISGTIAISGGGTGSTTASGARSNLGIGTSDTPTFNTVYLSNLNASRALISDSSKQVSSSVVTSTELGYLSGVSSAIQTQINTKAANGANSDITSLSGLSTPLSVAQGGTGASTVSTARTALGVGTSDTPTFSSTILSNLNASRVLISDSTKTVSSSAVTATELGYLSGTTSTIQTQLNAKASSGANSDITSLSSLSTPLSIAQGGTAASTAATARTSLGLGAIATQNSASVAITGGSLVGLSQVAVGTSTPLSTSAVEIVGRIAVTGNAYVTGNFNVSGNVKFSGSMTQSAAQDTIFVAPNGTNNVTIKYQASDSSGLKLNYGSADNGSAYIMNHFNGPLYLGTNETNRLTITGQGSIVPGSGALATNASDGFLYIPTCAGAPTGTPSSYTGRVAIIYDSTNNKIYIYNGSWKSITLS